MNILRLIRCSVLHRSWKHGPVEGWPSSLYRECQVCGSTWATGIRDWEAFNTPNPTERMERAAHAAATATQGIREDVVGLVLDQEDVAAIVVSELAKGGVISVETARKLMLNNGDEITPVEEKKVGRVVYISPEGAETVVEQEQPIRPFPTSD